MLWYYKNMLTFLTIWQIINPVLPSSVGSGAGEPIVGRMISAIVGILLIVGFVLALFHIIFGAVAWITAGGDKNKLQQAQERITSAIIGLVVMAAIWAIMLLIGTFLGFGFPKFTVPTFVSGGETGLGTGSGGGLFPPIPY